MVYANVFPKQIAKIPWGWESQETSVGYFVVKPAGAIQMPKLAEYFDFSSYTVEGMCAERAFGTRNFKSPFTTACRFLGFENALITHPDLSAITDEFLRWHEELWKGWGSKLKWFHIGDDFAGNQGLFMRPELWRVWLLPEYSKLIRWAHQHYMEVIFHSDGDIFQVLPDLVGLFPEVLDYQPIGLMTRLYGMDTYHGMQLFVNSAEEQGWKNEPSLSGQKEKE